ncbi:uncharacterized protein LOC131849151 [Achroia grisella]|uniref:uncharacterized protein LOC131849151 n=1 Tax=Achroia grisella TaxID=688607 RepID=UPI0027D23933|nr:uncharacterized protein LOC131849151 [Achroia grisella]
MPCKCFGFRYEKCKCGYVGSGCPKRRNGTGAVVFLAKDSAGYMHQHVVPAKHCILARYLENLYEKCARYNLRYCPFRRYVSDNYFRHTICDILVLLCFVVANVVVFLTILARTTIHAGYVVVNSLQWIQKYNSIFIYIN